MSNSVAKGNKTPISSINYLTRYLNPNDSCEVKSTELIKQLNEEKLEKCSDVAGKLFQVRTIR